MDHNSVKITDVITSKYADFLSFCAASGKVFTSDLTNVDYVAFRTSSGQTREYIKSIKTQIENSVTVIITSLSDTEDLPSQCETKEEKFSHGFNKVKLQTLLSNSADGQPVMYASVDTVSDTDAEVVFVEKEIENSFEGQNSDEPVEVLESQLVEEKYPESPVISDPQCSLANLLDVEASVFANVSIDLLNLGTRGSNCLKRAECITLENLLNKTFDELRNIKNMGAKSLNRVVQAVKDFVLNPENVGYIYLKKTEVQNVDLIIDNEFKATVEALIIGDNYSTNGMTEIQLERFEMLKTAVEVVGEGICLEIYLNPGYGRQICNMLWNFASPYIQYKKALDDVINKVNNLTELMKERKVIPFIRAYSVKEEGKLSYLLSKCKENTTINQIPLLFKEFREEDNMLVKAKEIYDFLDWLNFDLKQLIHFLSESIRNKLLCKNERALEIFSHRIAGKTLEEIGAIYGVSRERIRQIEDKVYRTFRLVYSKQKYDLIMLAYAMRDGDTVLYFGELKEVFGDFAETIWACIQHYPQKFYYYSKTLDAVVINPEKTSYVSEKDLLSKVDGIIKSLPEIIKKENKDDLLISLSNEHSLPLEILENTFKDTYQQSGIFYHKGRLTVLFMCSYVLKHRFPAGFKVADNFEADRFRQYMSEFFGDKSSGMTNRALDSKVSEVGVLCDRGKYIHPDFLQVEQSVIDKVNDFIENSPRSLIPYGEIFEAMRDTFEGTQITNRYLLQGALKKYGCRFSTGRDFIKKNQSVTFVDELDTFVEERGIVHKSEILAEFTSLNEANLAQVVARSANVFNIDSGYYIHASQFDIQPDDYEQIRNYLKTACQDIPVNIRSLQEIFTSKFPEFMCRNDFENKNKLFAALNFMFKGEFNFSRPYIANLGVNDISNKSVILQHIEKYDSIEFEELIDICDENSIHYVAASYLFQMLTPEYVRINKTTLMKREYTGITDNVIAKAVEIITDMLEVNDYIVASKISDFLWFPQVEVDWNEFLLESLIIQSGKINIVNLIGDPLKHPNAVYVTEKYKNDNFDSLLIKILNDEVHRGSFTSKVEMRDWLREEGLIEGKLPKFLESSKYFYVNETGVHCTGE